ncbi:hypothetical protein Pla175_41720 [Pirellulimonas nuda]|uniref:Uncharacterized protein n=1 Tax=Pirellulimonas nuda TaxID=2528009 RepID=A0A518DH05_9BACT|nr:hypothetical protein [Pirellulimonas nuda]QDU90760.1 hypothetical protein Pla175_41720 [Pirellulimonas nuda]
MHDSNPYSAPQTADGRTGNEPRLRPPLRLVRVLIYAHLAVVCYWAAFTLSDTGQIEVPRLVTQLFSFLPLQIPLAISWLIFPGMMVYAVSKTPDRSPWYRVQMVAGDILLSAFQLWVMGPLVQ